jgi:hypothetical protein
MAQELWKLIFHGLAAPFLGICAEADEKNGHPFGFKVTAVVGDKIDHIGQGMTGADRTAEDDGVVGYDRGDLIDREQIHTEKVRLFENLSDFFGDFPRGPESAAVGDEDLHKNLTGWQ